MPGTAKAALEAGMCLELAYNGFNRTVEVHAVGRNHLNHDLMRVWQVAGGSVSNEPVGWKLMRLDRTFTHHVGNVPSQAPRPGYKKGDRHMTVIIAEV